MPDIWTISGRPGGYYDSMFGQEALGGFFYSPQAAEQNWNLVNPRPWDYAPRRVTWQEREEAKFKQDVYTRPCWYKEPWWVDPGHFAHVSLEDPTQIAFTENDAKGDRDIQLRMKPGKYLNRFFGDQLTPKQIAFFAEWFAKGEKPNGLGLGLGAIQFASTPDAIVDVYRRGPYSCMRGDREVRVYGAGDLSVAYVEQGDKVISRALCWPAKKVFGRVYPTLSSHGYWQHDFATEAEAQAVYDDLFFRLRDMGWQSYDEGGTMAGARLLRIENDGYIVGPYVDGYNKVHEDPTNDDFLILGAQSEESIRKHGRQDYYCSQQTSGYFGDEPDDEDEDENRSYCQRCEDGMDADGYTVYDTWVLGVGPDGSENWCNYCSNIAGRSFFCDATEENYDNRASNATSVIINTDGGTETWVDGYADHHAFESDHSGDWFKNDLLVTMHDGSSWGRPEFTEDGFHCVWDGKNYPNGEMSERWDGWPAIYDSKPFTHAYRRKCAS